MLDELIFLTIIDCKKAINLKAFLAYQYEPSQAQDFKVLSDRMLDRIMSRTYTSHPEKIDDILRSLPRNFYASGLFWANYYYALVCYRGVDLCLSWLKASVVNNNMKSIYGYPEHNSDPDGAIKSLVDKMTDYVRFTARGDELFLNDYNEALSTFENAYRVEINLNYEPLITTLLPK